MAIKLCSLREITQMALHYDPIRIKRLAISFSCMENGIILFQDLHLTSLHICLSLASLWFSPEILLILWEGLLNIDPHYLCQVSEYSHTQHFL